jgi:hypothetical protein
VALDHVIESFGSDLHAGSKTGRGVNPDLLTQFPLADRAVAAFSVVVRPMVEFEGDEVMVVSA